MGMKNSPCEGHLLRLDKETVAKFDKLDKEIVKALFDYIEAEGDSAIEGEPEGLHLPITFVTTMDLNRLLFILVMKMMVFKGELNKGLSCALTLTINM